MIRFAHGRRARAIALSLVTTAIVLILALAEWLIERFVAEHWRAAGTAIEIAVVLIAALVFRPVHQRVEAALEAAIYRRRRQALASMERFRHEMSAFDDLHALLQDVVAAIDRNFDTVACAVYLRRDAFRAESSSFAEAAAPVTFDDPLIVRFRSSTLPVRPNAVDSAAPGTHTFAMASAGDVNGFIAVQSRDAELDAEELHALSVLARELSVAAGALDPRLRAQKRTAPNNLPVDLPLLIGRENELEELAAAIEQSRFVTLTGAGGVGKTALALHCARAAMSRHQDGAWFVNLAPISDPGLVAATVLSALDASPGDGSGDVARLVEFLKPRDMLLVLDNCEQVVAAVGTVVAAILESCPKISILATSREVLHGAGEHVVQLSSLDSRAAVELFAERARAVSGSFDATLQADTIRSICERLDGIPLAIELAAARVRVLSLEEILERLHERFRLLSGGAASSGRHQTLAALIEWSYDLLNEDEQSLFRRFGVFRGSFSLAAAAAMCASGGDCDEYHVLDVLASLVDKSLLTVSAGETTRYRFLETIREFALEKTARAHEITTRSRQHAEYFSTVAAQAYREFDTKLPYRWLERLEPDIDNFRAALEWSLVDRHDEALGAQVAADCGPVFLRLQMFGEGLRWCARARIVPHLELETAARNEYVASMMYNNVADTVNALACANDALKFYRRTSDKRGIVRALSQVAQQYGRAGEYDLAQPPALEAIAEARKLQDPHLLVGVLRRCGFTLPVDAVEKARAYFTEALQIARSEQDVEETSLVLEWWSKREAAAGNFVAAIDLTKEALECAPRPSAQLGLELSIAGWLLAEERYAEARPHAFRGLELAKNTEFTLAKGLAVTYCAVFYADTDPITAANLVAFGTAMLDGIGWQKDESDARALENIDRIIRTNLKAAGTMAETGFAPGGLDEQRAMQILSGV